MLYVFTQKRYYSWHLGERMPMVDVDDVVAIQADGDELDLIKLLYPTSSLSRVVKFPQERSKLIFKQLNAKASCN